LRATLDNGLTVLLHENRAAKVVAFQAWVQTGSADEMPDEAGIAHVFEHMLFKGTARRRVGQIAQEVEGAGGEINAWTSFDQTVYHLVLASRYFDTGLDVLADAIFNSSFDPIELERELKVVLEEIKQGEDNPARVVTQALFASAYTEHPYRRPVIGFEHVVRGFTRDKLLDFFARWYVPSNMALVVVGDFDQSEALTKIQAAFGNNRGRQVVRPTRSEPPQSSPRMTVLTQDVREAQITFAYHIPGLLHDDIPALDVAAIILGQGDSSRLNLEVKRARQLVTDVYGYTYTPRDRGLFVIGATLPPRGVPDAARAMLHELVRMTEESVSEAELAKARSVVESDAIYQKETVQGFARKLGFYETVAGGLQFEEEYHRRVQALTPAVLRQTLARYVRLDALTGAALWPDADKERGKTRAKALEGELLAVAREVHGTRPPRRTPTLGPGAEVVRTKLACGATVLVKPDASVPLVAVRAVWNGGLRYEDPRVSGINNLLASLLTRGTKTMSAEAIMHEVEGMAGALAGFSGRNSFGVREELVARHWERGLEMMADCILHPAFAEDELEKERRQVLDELHAQEDNLSAVVFRAFSEELYRKHPYRMDVLGTKDTVSEMTPRRLAEYYRKYYPPGDMVLSVVGDVDPTAFVAKANALFDLSDLAPRGKGRRKSPPVPVEPARSASGPVEVLRHLPKQQAHLVVGFPGTTVAAADRYPLEVLSTILSGQGGRLFLELRDKQGLAYRVSAFSLEGIDPGYFAVYMACSPENLPAARAGIDRELKLLRDDLVGDEELERAKRYLVGSHDIGLQRKSALSSTIAFNECYGLGWDEYLRYAPAVLAVTANDVRRIARSYLDPQKSVIALVTPKAPASPRKPRKPSKRSKPSKPSKPAAKLPARAAKKPRKRR